MPTKLIILTGASGVGKTTLTQHLKQTLDSNQFDFKFFDSISIPSVEEMISQYGSPSEWQKAKTKSWITQIVEESTDKTIFFEGQMNIEFILESLNHLQFKDYKIFLVTCSDTEMRRRLIEERHQPELANEDMSNWLIYLNNQALQHNIQRIDTTQLSIQQTADLILNDLTT